MNKVLKTIGEVVGGVIYYATIIGTAGILLMSAISLQFSVAELRMGQMETYIAISDYFTKVSKLQEDVLQLADTIQTASINRDEILSLQITGAGKEAEKRDETLLKLVSNSKVNIEAELAEMKKKPSIEYLDSITVLIIVKEKADATEGRLSTGVVIKQTDDNTYIVTNKHACDPEKICYVKEGEDEYPVQVVKRNEAGFDVQVVKVAGKIKGKVPVKGLADIERGDKIYVMGHNLGRPFLYAEGVVAGFEKDETSDLIIASPTAPGNSGSGVIDTEGRLVGLVYAGRLINMFQMDLTHGICINSKSLRLFLVGYLNR
jgi:S1-C subfamily serine protease